MHIWVITSSYPRTPDESINAGVLARDLALAIRGLGHRVTVVTPDKPAGVSFDKEIEGIAIPWLWPTLAMADLSPKRLENVLSMISLFLSARRRLRRAAMADRPDGMVALWALPSGVFARWVQRWTGTPYVVWLLGSDVWNAGRYPIGIRALTTVLEDAAIAWADGRELAAQAERLTGCQVEFLPSIRKLPPPPEQLPEPTDVLYVGRFHPNKGPDVLIEAFALARMARPGLTLRLHGEGEMRGYLKRRVSELGLEDAVAVGPPLSAIDLAGVMKVASVLAIPSRIDSIPLILGDAAQARLPVVASDVGDMGLAIEEWGLGLSVPSEDPGALAKALLDVLERPLSSVGGPNAPSIEEFARTIVEALTPSNPARRS